VHPDYLSHFFRTQEYRRKISELAAGVNINNLRNEHIDNLEIPLPPLAEQRRIAAILDQADALRRARRRAVARLNDLGQAVFYEMFVGDSTYKRAKLSELCDVITDGTHYTPTYSESGSIFLSAKNVTTRRINWEDVKFIPNDLHVELQKRVSPKRDDILLAKNGTTGVAALVDRDVDLDIYVSTTTRAGIILFSRC
jgi:type I restriction enzyme S subunit